MNGADYMTLQKRCIIDGSEKFGKLSWKLLTIHPLLLKFQTLQSSQKMQRRSTAFFILPNADTFSSFGRSTIPNNKMQESCQAQHTGIPGKS